MIRILSGPAAGIAPYQFATHEQPPAINSLQLVAVDADRVDVSPAATTAIDQVAASFCVIVRSMLCAPIHRFANSVTEQGHGPA
jgi:hypothetical protein